jgi:hypothetical protein
MPLQNQLRSAVASINWCAHLGGSSEGQSSKEESRKEERESSEENISV